MGYRLAEIANLLDAQLQGDGNVEIRGIASLAHAGSEQITFLDNSKYRKYLENTKASAVILAPENLAFCKTNALITANPYAAYAKIASLFQHLPSTVQGIHPSAVVGEGCLIDKTASIGPNAVIGNNVTVGPNTVISGGCYLGENVIVGADCYLWSNVNIYYNVQIGNRVIIHSGVVIGSDGFGFAKDKGQWQKIPQLGGVIIEDDVEIGANTTIDRGALNDTRIGQGVKLDNQIQIGHNVKIGAHTVVAGCTGISGSAEIGKHCILGGGSGVAGHIKVADHVVVSGMTMVTRAITQPGFYSSGTGLQENREWHRSVIRFRQLDKMAKQIQSLQKQLEKLTDQNEASS